jgi:putative membrane protein
MEPEPDNKYVRDHLANERTYLAWIRTGIATMGFGVVIAKLRFILPAHEKSAIG